MSKKKELKKIPRQERKHSRCRATSLNFPQGMWEVANEDNNRMFIPAKDYHLLLKKYLCLVKRRRRHLNNAKSE